MIVYLSATMLSCHHLFIFVVFTILYENSSGQLLGRSGFEYDVQNSRQPKSSNNQAQDYFAQGDEHHRIVILVPQIPHQEKKKPKSHHHHHKVLPVVHSGKVIHAHHHHGKVDHVHGHDAKAKHDHKHHLVGGHKHSHFGVGSHKHKHDGKAAHHHKHDGYASHKHSHLGKGSIHHLHEKHHHHHHPKPINPAPVEPPMKKLTDFLRYGVAGGDENNVEPYVDQDDDVPRVKIDPEILRALSPALINSVYSSPIPGGRIIQIRVPDANDENLVKEFNIDTQSDVAVLKKNYVGENGGVGDDYGNGGFEYVGHAQEDEGEETDDKDGETEYQLGDGYKLAASTASGNLHGHSPAYNMEVVPLRPSRANHRVITHDGTYQYRYD